MRLLRVCESWTRNVSVKKDRALQTCKSRTSGFIKVREYLTQIRAHGAPTEGADTKERVEYKIGRLDDNNEDHSNQDKRSRVPGGHGGTVGGLEKKLSNTATMLRRMNARGFRNRFVGGDAVEHKFEV
jgi:hypothetical protein